MVNSKTKKIKTKTKKTQKINVYCNHTYYMRNNSDSNKKLISDLTNTLKENQWLKISNEKYKKITPLKITNSKADFKPQGSYYSKGGWLFNETCCNLDNEIVMIEVDYSNIYRITGKTPYTKTNSNSVYKQNMNNFVKMYGSKIDKYWCRNKKKMSINNSESCFNYREKNKCISNKKCEWAKSFKSFNYPYKTHSGLAIYPLPSYKWLHKNVDEMLVFNSYDVETLVLWNHEPVTKHYNLGTIREIIGKIDNKEKNNIENDFTKYLIPKLIEIIKHIDKNKIEK